MIIVLLSKKLWSCEWQVKLEYFIRLALSKLSYQTRVEYKFVVFNHFYVYIWGDNYINVLH